MTRILGIVSGKGGVGKSTVSANLSLALQKFGKDVVVVDCNLSTPHLSYYLGVSDYKTTINDVLLGRIDINSAFYNYNGLKYIPASLKLEDLIDIDLGHFKTHLAKLANKKTDFIILDSAPGLGKEALSVVDASNEIIFVTTPFIPMINDVIRCRNIVKKFGDKKMSIILNMVTGRGNELKANAIEKITNIPVMGEVLFDNNLANCLALREPIVECKSGAIASISFLKLASILAEKDYEVPLKFRFQKFLRKVRNSFSSDIQMPQKLEDIKEEFINPI